MHTTEFYFIRHKSGGDLSVAEKNTFPKNEDEDDIIIENVWWWVCGVECRIDINQYTIIQKIEPPVTDQESD